MKKLTILISFLLFFSLFALCSIPVNAVNTAPIITNPIPLNNSINNSLAFNWYCDINDTEGNIFNFTIELNDGQNANGTDQTNLTTFIILSGLTCDTNYTVWVNCTDNQSAISKYTFYFTTIVCPPPDNGNVTPTDFNALIMGLAITMLIVFLLFIIYELMFVDNKMPFIQKIMICIFVMVLIVIAVGVIASFI
jgi:hypothetical protein